MSKSTTTSETPLPRPIPASDELGPLVGRTFGGYEITSYIGEGPTGAVYRAEDLVGGRMAVKVMHRELSRKPAADQLWADLQKLASLGSTHHVKVYDAGFDDDGQFYYAMDELPGCDLEAGLEESGALAPKKALEIVRQVCEALGEAHEAGVVHGGLKPRNVFLVPLPSGLTVKVLDFGAARLAGGMDKGVIVGNPFYMAPEQFGGSADARTDVYSLGVLMYELFSGTLPFSGPSHGQVMMRHLAEVPQPPPGTDDELGRIILRALVKAPAGRFQTVRELKAALDRWASSSPSMLADAAAFQVISRAAEARAMKQAALSAPDATTPMPKLDLAELARGSRHEDRASRVPPIQPPMVQMVQPPQKNKPTNGNNGKHVDPNSSESVEASLEDFISQANASFPTGNTDGFSLHTGDVELLDEAEEELESEEHVSAPIKVKPQAQQPISAPQRHEPSGPIAARQSRAMPAVQPMVVEPAPVMDDPALDDPEPLDPPPSAPRRRVERTEVVAAPSAHAAPWTANPLVVIGGLLAAFIIGAGLVFLMVKTMMPTQPVVVQAPAPQVPQVIVQPAPQQPVVTPLPQAAQPAAQQPVVTPLPQPAAAAPQAAAPIRAEHHHAAAHHRAPERHAAPRAQPSEPASTPKPATKASSKKSDWVDPFAQ